MLMPSGNGKGTQLRAQPLAWGVSSRSWYCPAPNHTTAHLPCSTLAFMPLQSISRTLVCFSLSVVFILAHLLTSLTMASALVFSQSTTYPRISFPALWFDMSWVCRFLLFGLCYLIRPDIFSCRRVQQSVARLLLLLMVILYGRIPRWC